MTERTPTLPPRPARERWRIDAYLLRVDWHLEGVVGGAERRSILRSLREELAADPRDAATALRDLGTPALLASRYGDEGAERPLWSVGVIIAGITLLAYWAVFFSYAAGMLAAVQDVAATTARSTFLWIEVEAFSTPTSLGIGWTSDAAWIVIPVVIALLAFLLGARAWRLLHRDDAHLASA